MRDWRGDWDRMAARSKPELAAHRFEPKGYIVQQHLARVDRPVKVYERWASQIPSLFHEFVLGASEAQGPLTIDDDPFCIAMLKHFASLVPFAQQARKPIFDLKIADGIGGGQILSVTRARGEFEELVKKLRAMLTL
jgi:chromosome partitioning protein